MKMRGRDIEAEILVSLDEVMHGAERTLTLRVVGQDAVVISKSDIQSRENSKLSMMPEAMLEAMSDAQVLDLFAYLMGTKQVAPAEE